MIGFTVLFNYFSRIMVHKKQRCCMVQLMKKEVRPFDRTTYAMKVLRVIYYPAYYYKLMERMNLMHYGVNRYLNDISSSS